MRKRLTCFVTAPVSLIAFIALIGVLVSCDSLLSDGSSGRDSDAHRVTYHGDGATGGSVPVDSSSYSQGQTVVVLENSGNLVRSGHTFSGWSLTRAGTETVYTPGSTFAMPGENVDLHARWLGFALSYVPVPSGGTIFPTGDSDLVTQNVADPFYIAKTLVTYELWKAVYDWATHEDRGNKQYTFDRPGRQGCDMASWEIENSGGDSGNYPIGNSRHPATNMSFLDALVWCNALTEWHNHITGSSHSPAYLLSGSVLRASSAAEAVATLDMMERSDGADGFRLVTHEEWELAGKWRYDDVNAVADYSNPWFTPSRSGSGAVAPFVFAEPEATNEVAWWLLNGGGEDSTTREVALLRDNALGLYDMSGNVEEFSFTLDANSIVRYGVRNKGWFNGDDVTLHETYTFGGANSRNPARSHIGFRVGRNGS